MLSWLCREIYIFRATMDSRCVADILTVAEKRLTDLDRMGQRHHIGALTSKTDIPKIDEEGADRQGHQPSSLFLSPLMVVRFQSNLQQLLDLLRPVNRVFAPFLFFD